MAKLIIVPSKGEFGYLEQIGRLAGVECMLWNKDVDLATEVESAAHKVGATAIVTTNEDYIKKLLPPEASMRRKGKRFSAINYAGSILSSGRRDIDVLVTLPFRSIHAFSYGEWLMRRLLSKVTAPHEWREQSDFQWKELVDARDMAEARARVDSSFLVSIDIETIREPMSITEYGFTTFHEDGTSMSYVMRMDSMAKVGFMREINATPQPKVCQNGAYECAYFFAYSAPMTNYIADTKNAMHAWQAELPKDLAYLSALFIRNVVYWKDMSESSDPIDQMRYNCLDHYYTGEAFLSWMAEAPSWAFDNYITRMSTQPYAHQCEMRGIKADEERIRTSYKESLESIKAMEDELAIMADTPGFNVGSHKQVKELLFALGHRGKRRTDLLESSDEKTLTELITTHPLSEILCSKMLEIRKERKLASTYLSAEDKGKLYKGRYLYALDGTGTDTGRYASRAHHFWVGLQIQNIPSDSGSAARVKETFIADDGYIMFEIDKSQAEARGVAYCSGDPALLDAIASGKDFHSLNASAFFGVPYHEIYQDEIPEHFNEQGELIDGVPAKTLNRALRDLSKRVNHGANYNMGAQVLLDTMGSKAVRQAQHLLGLPQQWQLLEVTRYLLTTYERTYPTVKTRYYQRIIAEVSSTKKMLGPTGWTRYCHGDPRKNKMDLNGYVAHKTQSLNAMDLDQGFLQVHKWQIAENNWQDIQVFTQIHDSILGQVREGMEHLVYELQAQLHNPIEVTCSAGITRTMDVPTEVTIYGKRWSAAYD